MDQKLVAWARAVKARRRGAGPPPLWLFTDAARMPDLAAVLAGLPRGLCGVVFRHDGVPGRPALALAAIRLCRARRMPLSMAGDPRLARRLGVPCHLRGGRGRPAPGLQTSSAHTPAELRRASRSARLVFLSPAFPTASHPGSVALGPARWAKLARPRRHFVCALGGVTGASVRRLPRWVAGAGAIGALLPGG